MTGEIDYSKFYNPYDFGNPIKNRDLFSGREKELTDIRYYLDQAIRAPRPINLALLGSRASGKTSLLNMIEIEATDRYMCPVRINLNEGDVKEEMAFFYKIFDCVLTSACDFQFPGRTDEISHPFGGKTSKTYQTYLDMISAFDIPEDKEWCPFIFPIQYAKSMSRGTNARVSDQNFMSDLLAVHQEVKTPMILLFDECNVLAKQPILLEMLRNVFMNTPGYMLVFTGTEDLFPVMDEVFSPIIRQFKKIEVGSFETTSETKDCIAKPLESIGIYNLEDVFERRTLNELSQIHDLTGGRPYEIQLLCHFMFRRVQMQRRRKMELDLDVLDDVLNELKRGHDIDTRPIIGRIRELTEKNTSALTLLLSCNKQASLDQIWFVEFIFNGQRKWKKQDLEDASSQFHDSGIIVSEAGVLAFAGDEFDRIYVKYFARKRRVGLSFRDRRPEEFFNSRLASLCVKLANARPLNELIVFDLLYNLRMTGPVSWPAMSTERENILTVIEKLIDSPSKELRPLKEATELVRALYWLIFENELSRVTPRTFLNVCVTFPWAIQNYAFYLDTGHDSTELSSLSDRLDIMSKRAHKVGGSLTLTTRDVELGSVREFASVLNHQEYPELVKSIVDDHLLGMTTSYLMAPRRLEAALLHAELAMLFDVDMGAGSLNNVGYLQLAAKNLGVAEETLTLAIDKAGANNSSAALPFYNRGVLKAMQGNLKASLENLRSASRLYEEGYLPPFKSVTIFVPTLAESGALEFPEKSEIDLADALTDVVSLLEMLEESATTQQLN